MKGAEKIVALVALVALVGSSGFAGVASAQGDDGGQAKVIPVLDEDAEGSDDAAVEAEPEVAELVREAGKLMVIKGDLDGAIALCTRAVARKGYLCYAHLGLAYEKKGEVAKACANYTKLATHMPKMKKLATKKREALGCE